MGEGTGPYRGCEVVREVSSLPWPLSFGIRGPVPHSPLGRFGRSASHRVPSRKCLQCPCAANYGNKGRVVTPAKHSGLRRISCAQIRQSAAKVTARRGTACGSCPHPPGPQPPVPTGYPPRRCLPHSRALGGPPGAFSNTLGAPCAKSPSPPASLSTRCSQLFGDAGGLESQLCYLVALGPWASYFYFSGPQFPHLTMKVIISIFQGCCENC